MLLLYHIRKGNALTPNSPFTFHYASTLSGVEAPSALTAKIFTFHYASTLSVIYHMQSKLHTIFTFHYASTLSIKTGYRRRAISNLHSTMLLLYLCPDLGWREWMHLHSTMLLLYLSVLKGCLLVIIIYIPLCFYFIEVSRFYRKKSTLIYIPLCFYFIAFTTTKSASTL